MLTLRYFTYFVLMEFTKGAFGYIGSKENEGFPEGFLSNCKYLVITVR